MQVENPPNRLQIAAALGGAETPCVLTCVVGPSQEWLRIWTLPPCVGFGGERFKTENEQKFGLFIFAFLLAFPAMGDRSICGNGQILGPACRVGNRL